MFSSKSTAENTKKNFFLLAAILDAENWKKKNQFSAKKLQYYTYTKLYIFVKYRQYSMPKPYKQQSICFFEAARPLWKVLCKNFLQFSSIFEWQEFLETLLVEHSNQSKTIYKKLEWHFWYFLKYLFVYTDGSFLKPFSVNFQGAYWLGG